jgi:epoxyqueuosine reductase
VTGEPFVTGEPSQGDAARACPAPELTADLRHALDTAGFAHRLAPASVADELAEILADALGQGELTQAFFDRYQESLAYSCPKEVGEPRTLIVTAARSPNVKVRFQLEDGPFDAVIPSTYLYSEVRTRTLQTMRSVLGPAGYHVAPARAPVKLLAVRTGLAQYGRNNIAYVKNMGSFVRLDAYCTDAPLAVEDFKIKGSWRLSSCPPCRNCHHVCPTGCIPYDGKIIDAERCLTSYNENERDWPEGLDPLGHNALVGCTLCQERCPVDRVYFGVPKLVAEFDRDETEWILRDLPADHLPPTVRAKLATLDIESYSSVLGRNLRALVAAARNRTTAYNGPAPAPAPAQRGER